MEINLDEKEVRIVLTALNRYGIYCNHTAYEMAQKSPHVYTRRQVNSTWDAAQEIFALREKIRKGKYVF